MNITTINDICFPVVLFLGYVSLACLLVSQQGQKSQPQPASRPQPPLATASALEIPPAAPLNVNSRSTKPLEAINLKQLPLRQARKVAKVLGIKQSIKGKTKPVKMLRAEIQQQLQEKPTMIDTILKLLSDIEAQPSQAKKPTASPSTSAQQKQPTLAKPPSTTQPAANQICLEAVDPERLTLRQARKVAKALGIKRSVKGKDKPLQFLRAEIKQTLAQKPSAPDLKRETAA